MWKGPKVATGPKVHVACRGGYLQCVTYLIAGAGGAVLVDPGSSVGEEEILRKIGELGLKLGDVRYALITHCHVDHALGAYRFRELGARLVGTPYTAEVLKAGGRQVWYEYPAWVVPTPVDVTIADGESLRVGDWEIQAIHTPGHTPGCASYLVRTAEGLTAFTGDLYNSAGALSWAGSEGFSTAETLRSLERLQALAPAVVHTGHGTVRGPAAEWLGEAIRKGRAGKWVVAGEYHPDAVPDGRLRVRPPEGRTGEPKRG